MKKFLLLLLSASAATVAAAQSENLVRTRFYVQPSVIIAVPGDDFDSAGGVAIAAGVSFRGRHSVEAEFIQFETELDKSYLPFELDFSYIIATYKYRIPITPKFSAYAGGSVGRVSQKASVGRGYYIVGSKSDDTLALGLTGGVQYQLNEHVVFDGGMKVLGQDDTRFTTNGSVLLIQASVKFQF